MGRASACSRRRGASPTGSGSSWTRWRPACFDGHGRAAGVEYLKGERLYRAHARPSGAPGERREVRALREVILAGGAFNTPQLLMLSGLGPRAELRASRHPRSGRPARRRPQPAGPLRGLGRQPDELRRLGGDARFAKDDPLYREATGGCGLYATNGAGLALIKRSAPERALPDLFCMALLARFSGYYPGYASDMAGAQLPERGCPQGRREPGREAVLGIGRPARPAAGHLPLFRGRRRRGRRGP